jgi:anti-sigma B factor antagonist
VAESSVHGAANAPAGRCLLAVAGDVDITTADQLAQAGLRAVTEHPTRTLVLDLREVTFMDSTGLNALLTLRDAATRAGTQLRLRDIPRQVQKILAITALDQLFAPHRHRHDPRRSWTQPETLMRS